MLDPLKRELKDLVGLSQHDEVFRRLKEDTLRPTHCDLYNDTVVIQSRHSDSKRAGNLGIIDFKEKNLQFNNVSQALVWLIDGITLADLSETCRQRLEHPPRAIPGYHVFTCDRVDQTDAFEPLRTDIKPGSQHFFYLFGGELQAHKSFFARVAYELEGRYRADGAEATVGKPMPHRAAQVTFAVDECRDPQVLRERFVRNLFSAFGLIPDDFHPLLHQNLGTLLERSEKTRGLTANDYLCVFVHISHWAWNKNLTPQAAFWFIQTFCQCALRPDGPALLFFFAFDYDEEQNPGVREEVLEAVRQSQELAGLPELGMVLRKDVALWLVRYQHLFPSAEQRKQMLAQRFGHAEYFMEDVEMELQKLIDHCYNAKNT